MGTSRNAKVTRLKKRGQGVNPNPVYGSGDRNLFCSHYSQCLDFAIGKGWDSWACFECPNRKKVVVLDDFPATNRDVALYHELPREFHRRAS